LGQTNLSGSIPECITNFTNLNDLWLSDAEFSGELPENIGNLININFLRLDKNNFTGAIPESIANLAGVVTHIWLQDNQFSELPESICEFYPSLSVVGIHFDNNNICPPYPACISPNQIGYQNIENCEDYTLECEYGYINGNDYCYNQDELNILNDFIENSSETLNLNTDDNQNGIIEPWEWGWQFWYYGHIWALFNGSDILSGEIPSSIGNLTNLQTIYFSDSQLSGQIPDSIENLEYLSGLYLPNNQLSGYIPIFDSLLELDLSYNQFSGVIPENIVNMENLWYLKLNDNQLTGEIPSNICNFNINWDYGFNINNNKLCPPYPECIQDYIEYQDTSECLECILGDVNYDYSLDILDVVIISITILNDDYNECGDINLDGELNILDLVTLVNIILYDEGTGDINGLIDAVKG